MKAKVFLFFLLLLTVNLQAQDIKFPSGDQELDLMRQQVSEQPTEWEDFRLRCFKMKLWMVLLQQQGADLTSYLDIDKRLRKIVWWNTIFWNEGKPQQFTEEQKVKLCKIVDDGFMALEQSQKKLAEHPPLVKKSDRPAYASNEKSPNWTHYKGDNGLSGFTGAMGPQQGEMAFKFPVGLPWESAPVVDGNVVYLSSPGMRETLYAVDIHTGEKLWTNRQTAEIMMDQIYNTPSNMSTPVVLEDVVMYRECGSRGNKGPSRDLVYVDKKTGETIKQVEAGHVDYRVGLPAFSANEKYAIFPHGVQDIEAVPAIAQSFNRIICRDQQSGKKLWDFNIGHTFCPPVLDGNQVYVANQIGYVYGMRADLKLFPASSKRLAWQFRAKGSVNEEITYDDRNVYFGDNAGFVYALDKNTGAERWSYQVKNPNPRAFRHFSKPLVHQGKLIVGGANQELYIFDKENGNLEAQLSMDDWVRAQPTAQNDHLFVATMKGSLYHISLKNKAKIKDKIKIGNHAVLADLVSTDQYVLVNDTDLKTRCYDLKGKLKWELSQIACFEKNGNRILTDQIAGGARFMSKPTVVDGVLYFGTPMRFVYAVDAKTGEELWKFEAGASQCGAPVYDQGKLYFGVHSGEDEFYCVDAKTGKPEWTQDIGWVFGSPNVSDGMVYVPSIDGNVNAMDAETGALIWRHRLDRSICSEPMLEKDQVFWGSWDHYLYAMDKKTGHINWKFPLDGGTDSGVPIVKNDRIYLPIGGPRFRCLNALSGEVLWEYFEQGATFNVTPAYHNGKVFASTWRGVGLGGICVQSILYGMDASTGEVLWEHPGGGLSGPVVGADGTVYCASVSDPFLYAIKPEPTEDGSPQTLWMYDLGNKVEESTPALYDGMAYVMSSDGYLHAIK